MLSTNETLSSSSVSFFLTDDEYMQCLINVQLWTRAHFLVTILVNALLFVVYAPFSMCITFFLLFYPRFDRFTGIDVSVLPWGIVEENRYIYFMRLLIKEVKLIFVYVQLAFLCRWVGLMDNDYRITSLDIRRWLIEASFAPFIIVGLIVEYCAGCENYIFERNQFAFVLAPRLKVAVFILMRWAEIKTDFFVNTLESFLIRRACQSLINKQR